MTDKTALICQMPMRKRPNLDMDLSKPSTECSTLLPFGYTKESRSENSDTLKNSHQLSSSNYENMRLLIERQERDLGELREFANLERESLQFHVLEQQEQINAFLKVQSETHLSDKERGQTQNRRLSLNNLGESQKVKSGLFFTLNLISYGRLKGTRKIS
jgi:hypothetical protein